MQFPFTQNSLYFPIKLDCDFIEMNISKTFTLIHLLYHKADNKHTFSIPATDKELLPYLQQFLPLFVVRFPPINPKCSIHLLQQNESHHLMWEGHFRKGQS